MKNKNQLVVFFGVFLLLFGIASGITMLQQKVVFRLRADPKTEITQVWVTNINENSVTISWKTQAPSTGFVKFNDVNSGSTKVALPNYTKPKIINSVEIESLSASSLYEFSIFVNGNEFKNKAWNFKTAQKAKDQVKSYFINGQIFSKDNEPIENAVILVYVSGSSPLSTISDYEGKWSIDISQARTQSLSNHIVMDEQKTVLDIKVYAYNSSKEIRTVPILAQNMNVFLE
ncbi:MAG: fibronectin type III domain-containing protein [Patescibacteria group bacterium]|nr:fibronectin type III domain-containing protein [Patescibacteria group bacterium]